MAVVTIEMMFIDGPKAGDAIQVANPPPQFMKLAMPEWAVYERVGDTSRYRVAFEGLTARAWRNPERPAFL